MTILPRYWAFWFILTLSTSNLSDSSSSRSCDEHMFFGYGCMLQGEVYILNCQRATLNMLTTLTQSKTLNSSLPGCHVRCAKVVSVTLSDHWWLSSFVRWLRYVCFWVLADTWSCLTYVFIFTEGVTIEQCYDAVGWQEGQLAYGSPAPAIDTGSQWDT